KQLLANLRLLKRADNLDFDLNEQRDYVRILYHKGLYLQTLKLLDRVKEQAIQSHQDSVLIQVIYMEKKIETLHITRRIKTKADTRAQEAIELHDRSKNITSLYNLA